MRRLALALLGCALALPAGEVAAGGASKRSAPAAARAKARRAMEIKSAEDLLKLRTDYQEMWDAGFDGTLEVTIRAGTYPAVGWALSPNPSSKRKGDAPTIDVILRGPATIPAPGKVKARSLVIEELVLTGARSAPIELEVGKSFAMRRAALIDGRFGDPMYQGTFFEIRARGTKGSKAPVTVAIDDSWFVRNFQEAKPMAMVGLTSATEFPGYFEEVSIRRSAFLGNAFMSELAVDFARKVKIEDSIFYKTWPGGTVLRFTSTADVTVKRCAFAVEEIGQVATVEETPPIAFEDSRIYARGWAPGQSPPPALRIDPPKIIDRKAFEPQEKPVAEAAKLPSTAVPPPELFKRIHAAFWP
jgi:hypothetical protein